MRHRTHARYGWVPDLPDARDHFFSVAADVAMPAAVDLRAQCPAVYDQGRLGSCTANAIGGAVQFEWLKQDNPAEVPSRLFIYYCERMIEGSIYSDSGAMLRDGIKVVAQYGAPFETLWPYDITKFTLRPPQAVWAAGLQERAVAYARVVQTLGQMRACLASGYPFAFGFSVYESFESDAVAASGVVPLPASSEELLGGHAVLAVGYDDASQRFIVRNSWGAGWGQGGYFTMPYAYLGDRSLASDLWTIRLMAKAAP
jgi:C1A family cysteine protease